MHGFPGILGLLNKAGRAGEMPAIMQKTTILAICALSALACPPTKASDADAERRFRETIHPFLKAHCLGCHNGDKPKGDMDLSVFSSADSVAKDLPRWELVLEQLEAKSMPPAKAKSQPKPEARGEVIEWIIATRKAEGKRNAGDPGAVAARRLSNAEYDHTIRDLTGFDLRPTMEFPVDPANEAGFDNSAESLTMSPALVKKYLEAARFVANHLVLKPRGFAFAPHEIVADTDRDKYCVRRVIDFYKQQRTDYADFFLAAWRYRNREAMGKPQATLAEIAKGGRDQPLLPRHGLDDPERAGRRRRPDRGDSGHVPGAPASGRMRMRTPCGRAASRSVISWSSSAANSRPRSRI